MFGKEYSNGEEEMNMKSVREYLSEELRDSELKIFQRYVYLNRLREENDEDENEDENDKTKHKEMKIDSVIVLMDLSERFQMEHMRCLLKEELFRWVSRHEDSLIEVIEKCWTRDLINRDDEMLSYFIRALNKRKSELKKKIRESEAAFEVLMTEDPLPEDWKFSEIYVDESKYSEDVNSFLCYGNVVLIVEEDEIFENRNRTVEANSVMLGLMFSYFHHMFLVEEIQRRKQDDSNKESKREYVLSIDHVGVEAVSVLLKYLREFDVSSIVGENDDNEIPLTCCLSFSILVLLDFLDVREEGKEYIQQLIEALKKYLVNMRLKENGLEFLEYLSEFSVEELIKYEKMIPNEYLSEFDSELRNHKKV